MEIIEATLAVYLPDPVSSSGDKQLSDQSPTTTLELYKRDTKIDIHYAGYGNYTLNGNWVEMVDLESPAHALPGELYPSFSFPVDDPRFLATNTFYWLETFIHYLESLNITNLNNKLVKIDCDSAALGVHENAQFVSTPAAGRNQPRILLGGGSRPLAIDMSVVLHEFVHAIIHFLDARQGRGAGFEHAFCDAIPAIFRDRYVDVHNRSLEAAPFYHSGADRSLDMPGRFDDTDYLKKYRAKVRRSMLGSTFWECYDALCAGNNDRTVREEAGNLVIRSLVVTLTKLDPNTSTKPEAALHIASKFIETVSELTGDIQMVSLFKKVFQYRGLMI